MKISEVVRELIGGRPYLSDALAEGLINHSALARLLLPEVRKKARRASPGAVHVAIRRYAAALPLVSTSKEIESLLSGSALSLKSSLVDFVMKRNPLSLLAAREVAESVKWEEGESLYLIQGASEMIAVADARTAEKMREKAGEYNIRARRENLAAITLKSPEWASGVPGFYSLILSSLSRARINIRRLIPTSSELVIVVDSSQATACYETLSHLIERGAGRP